MNSNYISCLISKYNNAFANIHTQLKISSNESSRPVADRKIKRIERIRPSPSDQSLTKDATSTNDSVPITDLKDTETVDSGNIAALTPLTDIPISSENTISLTEGPKDEASKADVATEIAAASQVAEVDKQAVSAVSQEIKEPEIVEVKSGVDSKEIERENLSEKGRDAPKLSDQQESKSESTLMKVQDQLEEVSSFFAFLV